MDKHELISRARHVIGRPYDSEEFTCWSLCEEVVKAPKVEHVTMTHREIMQKFKVEAYPREGWKSVPIDKDFKNGDILMLGNGSYIHHAGVYIEKALLHVERGSFGAVHEPLKRVLHRYKLMKAYRHVD